jgi:RNA-directed DNA polymerase
VDEVGALLYRGHPEVVDADLADYFGSIPHSELLKGTSNNDDCFVIDRRRGATVILADSSS